MKILIYGVGNMGKFFRDFFYSKGYYVKGYDIDKKRRETNTISNFDVIFVCTPMSALEKSIEHIMKEAHQKTLLVDISSVKNISLPVFKKSGFDFLSIHPMFGGDVEIALSNIIVVHESGREEERKILNEFRKNGAVLSKLTPEEHDKKMAEIQGISHFLLLSMANFLKYNKQELKYASPIFMVLYKLASRIINQNWEMYYEIQKNAEKIRKEFSKHISFLNENLKNPEKFSKMFNDLKNLYTENELTSIILEACKLTEKPENLDELRAKIKLIDSLLLKLIEERVKTGKKIARIKYERNQPIEIKEIEEEKIKDITSKTKLNPFKINKIFKNIISLTKEEEYRSLGIYKTVALLGPMGSFSDEIAIKLVGSRLPLKYCTSIDEVMEFVEKGKADYGIVPIENSINGTVLQALDALITHDIEVFGEAKLEINHCLVAKRKIDLREIKTLYSHPQAIAQCMEFINNYLPKVEIRYTTSTSDAAKLLDEKSAGIMSENAATLYKLYVLRKGIQDVKDRNITRFYLIRKKTGKKEGKITAMFFGVEDKPGALKNVLEVFYKKGYNLRKLESRPSRKRLGDYVFFVEVEAPLNESDLNELKNVTTFYKTVGVFDEITNLDVYNS